ncbi:MAG: putative toxin-antitoxin system toxin component, PIN family [Treponema sp.]|nr:putative toxin-antitoxin system toxin component, PIN family [Treponema sp.]
MKVVIDTNIVASAAFFGGLPEQLINLVLDNKITAVVYQKIVDEYEKTIQKLLQKYNKPPFALHFPFSTLVAHLEFITPVSDIKICGDPDDDKFISCALDGICPLVISGDHHLLEVKRYGPVRIITAREFFENYAMN